MSKPVPTPLTREFWRSAADGQLKMQRCNQCDTIWFPVGPVCTNCLSPDFDWAPVGHSAEVLSHLVFHRGYSDAWKPEVPYSVLMVQFAEGPRMFLDLRDPDKKYIEEDLVGQTIAIAFDKADDEIGIPRAVYPARGK